MTDPGYYLNPQNWNWYDSGMTQAPPAAGPFPAANSVDWLQQRLPKPIGDWLGNAYEQGQHHADDLSPRTAAGEMIRGALDLMPGRSPVSVSRRPLPYGDVYLKHDNGGYMAAAPDSGLLRVSDVFVPEALRGKGHGVDLYRAAADYAKSNGMRLASESQISSEAARVYEALGRRGYAVERNPLAQMNERGWGFHGPLKYGEPDWVYSVK